MSASWPPLCINISGTLSSPRYRLGRRSFDTSSFSSEFFGERQLLEKVTALQNRLRSVTRHARSRNTVDRVQRTPERTGSRSLKDDGAATWTTPRRYSCTYSSGAMSGIASCPSSMAAGMVGRAGVPPRRRKSGVHGRPRVHGISNLTAVRNRRRFLPICMTGARAVCEADNISARCTEDRRADTHRTKL